MSEKADKTELKYDPKQLEFLLKCSKEGNIQHWNKYVRKFFDKTTFFWKPDKINLDRANLINADLTGANLQKAHLKYAQLQACNLSNADLTGADLTGADLSDAILHNAKLSSVCFKNATLRKTDFKGARMLHSCFKNTKLESVNLQNTRLWSANLENATLNETNLKGARMFRTNLKGTKLLATNLKDTDFHSAQMNSQTTIYTNKFNENTNFKDVNLDICNIDSLLKISLKNIIRKKNWKKWSKKNPWWKKTPVYLFWKISDYGNSTIRIIVCFFGLAAVFGLIYWKFNDLVCGLKGSSFPFLRSMYFSVVTMTTLGFGDMYAAKDSYWGHILLMIQVILGYVLLGALITRFGIMFTQEGPAYPIPPAKPGIFSRIFKRLSKIISKPKDSDSK